MRLQEGIGPLDGQSMSSRRSMWLDWMALIKRSVARFARGNIAVQNRRVLFPEEQEREHARTLPIARQWKERAKHPPVA
jgi:hypothetical protein